MIPMESHLYHSTICILKRFRPSSVTFLSFDVEPNKTHQEARTSSSKDAGCPSSVSGNWPIVPPSPSFKLKGGGEQRKAPGRETRGQCSSGNSREGRLGPPDSLWGKVVTRGPRRRERGCRTGTASRGFLGFVTQRETINVASHSLFPTCRLSLMKGMMRVHNNAGIRGGEVCGWSLHRAMSQGAPLPPGGQAPPGAPC